jgi:hypothetical protein
LQHVEQGRGQTEHGGGEWGHGGWAHALNLIAAPGRGS